MPLNIENSSELYAYLRSHHWFGPDDQAKMCILAGGVSNRTVLVELSNGRAWVIKQALEKLRVEVDWFSDPARIHREAAALRVLPDLAPPHTITPLVFEDTQLHVLAMEAVPQPHENWKAMLMGGRLEADHVKQFGLLLGSIHHNASHNADRLATMFDDRSFYQSLRLEPYYQYAAQQVPQSAAFFETLIADTLANRFTLVHGDYSPKNILVHQGRLVLLDHEVIHWGDGAFDIGFALAHLLSKAHFLTHLRSAFTQAAGLFWQTYHDQTQWHNATERRAVRHGLGCLLARVRGRSTLEYLDHAHRVRQERIVVRLMADPPETVEGLAKAFEEQLRQS